MRIFKPQRKCEESRPGSLSKWVRRVPGESKTKLFNFLGVCSVLRFPNPLLPLLHHIRSWVCIRRGNALQRQTGMSRHITAIDISDCVAENARGTQAAHGIDGNCEWTHHPITVLLLASLLIFLPLEFVAHQGNRCACLTCRVSSLSLYCEPKPEGSTHCVNGLHLR